MEQLIPIFITQLVSTIAIIYSNKADIAWLKEGQKRHENRLTRLEQRV